MALKNSGFQSWSGKEIGKETKNLAQLKKSPLVESFLQTRTLVEMDIQPAFF